MHFIFKIFYCFLYIERETHVNLLFHLFIHSLVASGMCPDRIELATLVHQDPAIKKGATWPGLTCIFLTVNNFI